MVANLTSVTETEVCVPAREPPLVRPWTSHAPFLTREMRSQTPTSWRGSGTGDQPSQVCLGQRDFLGHKTFRAQTGTPQRTEVSRSPRHAWLSMGCHYLIIHGGLVLGAFLETAGAFQTVGLQPLLLRHGEKSNQLLKKKKKDAGGSHCRKFAN